MLLDLHNNYNDLCMKYISVFYNITLVILY